MNQTHNQAINALCGCAATVTVLSYQEAIEGYFTLRGITLAQVDALGFDAPPAVERALHPALPLIEAIAKWERENGTLAAIMPSEYGDFCRLIADAAVHGSARAAALHPSDREAIAREMYERFVEENGGFYNEGTGCGFGTWEELLDKTAWLSAAGFILALSGSLAPANPTEKGEL